METVVISPDLRVTLPASVLEPLGLGPGGELRLEVHGRRIELTPVAPRAIRPARVDPPNPNEPDPLLALSGTIHSDVPDAGRRHDEYIGQALYDEMHGRPHE